MVIITVEVCGRGWEPWASLVLYWSQCTQRRTVAVLRLHHGATLQSTAEATVDLLCQTVCFNQLFGDVNIFSIVLSKKLFKCLWNLLRRTILPFLLWGVYTTWTTTKILLSKMLSKILAWWFFTTSTTSQSISIEPHGSNTGFPHTYNHRHSRMFLQYIALSCLRLIWHCLVLMLFEERYDWKRWRPYTCVTLARQCL
jgi:hypothetical protein